MPKKPVPRRTLAGEPLVFGHVIAEREYRVGRKTILLQFGTPHRTSQKTTFYCPLRFVSGRQAKVFRAFGVDAVQALMLAFDRAKITIEETWPTISYAGSEKPGDSGIYRRLSGMGADFDKEVAILIEKAARARLGRLEITRKPRLGKLPGALAVAADVSQCVAEQAFSTLPISLLHAQRAGSLPGPHRDPFDRILIAQSQMEGVPIASLDPVFAGYGLTVLW